MKTAAAYIRVSTEDQTEYSPASQLEKIREYAKHHDYILPDEYIFVDEGISGRNTAKRAAFNCMIGMAKQKPKPFDAILLWKFSRFARNREDSIVYKSMLRKQCGIDVISISENVGDDKMSVLIEAMIEAMDEYYSINLSEEVKRGMAEKARRGEAVSIPSFGYRIENGRYLPDPETAPVVQRIYADFLAGKGMRTIASAINDSGLRTRRGNLFENRTVKYILQNPVYIGKIRWTPTGKANLRQHSPDTLIIDGTHPPIIDKDIWEQVQKKLNSSPKVKYMHTADPKEPFMLQGLVRCSACGATLTRSANGRSLQCYAYAHGKCKVSHSVTIERLNRFVFDFLQEAGVTGVFPLHILPPSSAKTDYAALLEKENKKLERIRDAYENGVYTLQEFKDRQDKILSQIQALTRQQAEEADAQLDEAAARLRIQHQIIRLLPTLQSPAVPETLKNQMLKTITERVVFYRSTGLIDMFFYV